MHGVTILWSTCAAMSLLVASIHLTVWCRNRMAWSSLALVLIASGVVGASVAEFLLMHAGTPSAYAATIRWANLPLLAVFAGIVWLVHLEFGTAGRWLGVAAIGLRALVLVLGYFPGPTPAFREITGLAELEWLGERIVVVSGAIRTPWSWLPAVSNVVLAAFVADAAVRLWRRGGEENRARAIRVGVPLNVFILSSTAVALLINARVLSVPYVTSVSFLAVVLMLGFELSRDLLRAHRLAQQLVQSERRLHLAGEAAGIGFWFFNTATGALWATDEAKAMVGFSATDEMSYPMFLARVHPEDRARIEAHVADAIRRSGQYAAEYRVQLPDGSVRRLSARGEISHISDGAAPSLIGVVFDVTDRHQAELELAEQRTQLAHLARVSTVGELSGSLAHELNQPLAIILTNAQAAQRLLARDPVDLAEARDILADIGHEAQRAGEVIRRLRGLLRRENVELRPLEVRGLVDEVMHLLRRDIDNHGVRVHLEVPADLPHIQGDAIQLQQVLLNLILNACEAMESCPAGQRVLAITAGSLDGHVRVSIADTGCGLPLNVERVFEPFYSTKSDGLGLGLPLCRTIVAAHRGRLWAEVRPPVESGRAHGGSVFHLELEALRRM